MKVFCSSCSKFSLPYECATLGVPTGPKKCNGYDRSIRLYEQCRDCEYVREITNTCAWGFDFKKIEKCNKKKGKGS